MDATEYLSTGVSAFEHYMLADDRPKYPMIFWFIMTLQGQADETRLSSSLNTALSNHPLLSSHLVGDPQGRRANLRWQHVKNAEVYLDRGAEGMPLRFPHVQSPGSVNGDKDTPASSHGTLGIDLSLDIGVRAFLRQGRENCTVYFQFHHSASDGLGAIRFIEDVLRCYHGAGGDFILPLRQPPPLKRRSFCGLSLRQILSSIPFYLVRAYGFYFSNPEPLSFRTSDGLSGAAASQCPAREYGQLSGVELAQLKVASRKNGASINDTLLMHVFSSVDCLQRFRELSGRIKRNRRVRVLVPVNLRQAEDQLMSAANMIGMVFLDRCGSILDHPGQLLQSLVKEMRAVKRHSLGFALNFATSLGGHIRGGVRALVSQCLTWRCAATVVFSNLGDPLADCDLPQDESGQIMAGGLTLRRLELLPPLRLFTNMTIGVVTYAGRLTMTAYYDHTVLSKQDARFMLQGILAGARAATAEPVATAIESRGADQLAIDF